MRITDRQLVRELGTILVLKLAAIFVLWWLFVGGRVVAIDHETAAPALLGPVAVPAPTPEPRP